MKALASLGAWWAGAKYLVILLGLLALSVWGNVWQYGNARAARAEARADVLEDTLETTAGIAKDAQRDNKGLFDRLETIVKRAGKDLGEYHKAAATAPLAPSCAPGAARMDAVNRGLGPEQ